MVGKDIAEALGYSKARNAIASHVDAEDKQEAQFRATGWAQGKTKWTQKGRIFIPLKPTVLYR